MAIRPASIVVFVFSDFERQVAPGATVPLRRAAFRQLRLLPAALPLGQKRHGGQRAPRGRLGFAAGDARHLLQEHVLDARGRAEETRRDSGAGVLLQGSNAFALIPGTAET